MDWTQTATIISSVFFAAYFIHRDIHSDMRAQAARSDRLYEMFIDLVKTKKDN